MLATMPRPFRALCLIPTAILTLLIVSVWFSPWPSDYISTNRTSAYRQQLSTVRELDRAPHSRTLGVAQRIYTIGLARRTDRREYMQALIEAMDIDVEWYDALDMTSPLVTTILERVRWSRSQSRIGHEKDIPNPQGLYFTWLPDVRSDAPVTAPAGIDLWFLPAGDPSALEPLPPPPSPDTRPPLLRTSGESNLLENEVISRAQVSCWYSHYQVLLKIAEGPDEVAIVLEDDVDMEWDLETRLGQMWPFLPENWDIVMLGHCHSKEYEKPSVPGYPHLHPSTHVLCTHAYAISRAGARRLVRHIRSPLFAFSRPIDHVIQHFNHHRTLNIYSVEPPVVIQMKNTGSDIVGGIGQQNQWLVDSVMERVAYHQKLQPPRREDS